MNEIPKSLVGPQDIAALAGVTPAAVSNWRKRDQSFPPRAAGSEANPLFDLAMVRAWLESTGRDVRTNSPADMVWASANVLRSQLEVDEIGVLVLGLGCARMVAPDRRGAIAEEVRSSGGLLDTMTFTKLERKGLISESFRRSVQKVDESILLALVDALEGVAVGSLGVVADDVLERTSRATGKRGGESGSVYSRGSALLASVAATRVGAGVFLDTACGVGSTLIALGLQDPSRRLIGQEVDPDVACILRQRAFLHDLKIEVHVGDTLAVPAHIGVEVDVVVAEPPFGVRFDMSNRLADPRFQFGAPPRHSADLAWVQDAIARLAADGRAFVITPAALTGKVGVESRIRAELVRRGAVEAVVALPPKMYTHTSTSTTLWVLRRPTETPQPVLLIDGSMLEVPKDAEVAGPEAVIPGWLAGEPASIPVPSIEVAAADLLADDAILSPERWTELEMAAPDGLADLFQSLGSELMADFRDASAAVAAAVTPPKVTAGITRTIDELVRYGALELAQGSASGRTLPNGDESPGIDFIVSARNVREGSLPPGAANIESENLKLTRPGDVLVITWNEISAIVDDTGGHALGNGVYRLRSTNHEVLRPAYLAAMLGGAWNARFMGGATIQRAAIRSLEIPLLASVGDQDRTVALIEGAAALEAAGLRIRERAKALGGVLRDAVMYGADLRASTEHEPADRAARAESLPGSTK